MLLVCQFYEDIKNRTILDVLEIWHIFVDIYLWKLDQYDVDSITPADFPIMFVVPILG